MALKFKLASLALMMALFLNCTLQACCLADHPSNEFRDIDKYALNAPDNAKVSIQALATYLTKPARNDREKARAIFRWIANNIDYNVSGFFNGTYGNSTAEGVLRSGRSVCGGYSNLFESLANASGLETVTITGYAKGYNYTPGLKFSGSTNHAWNAVKIDGKWQLVDSTWGAGYLENGKYTREFDDHYFLTPPEELIYDHFPEDQQWQLLNRPLTKEEFEILVYLKSNFFNLGLSLENPKDAIIISHGLTNITLNAPEDVHIMAELKRIGKNASSERTYGSPVLVRRAKEQYLIEMLPPLPGEYILRVYGKHGSDEGIYRDVMEYKVVELSGSKSSFPIVFDEFFDLGMRMNNHNNGTIEANGKANLSLYAPQNILIMVSLEKLDRNGNPSQEGKSSTFLQRFDDRYDLEILPPTPGEYVLNVFAKRKEDPNSYQGVLRYNVSASSGSDLIFPETFSDFQQNGVYLCSPLTGNLKSGLNQTFKLKIPGAEDAAIISGHDWHQLTKTGDIFQGESIIRKGEVNVGAKYSGKDEYSILLRYNGV